MKKPYRVLKVFGIEIPVWKIKDLLSASGMYGYYDMDKRLIGVESSLKSPLLEHTILHELFHATMDRLHVHQQLDEKFVEVIVESMAVSVIENFKLGKL